MKQGQKPEDRFRRVAVTAGIVIWVGIILLAVGLVFSIGSSRASSLALAALTPTYAETPTAATSAPAPATVVTATATATATWTPRPAQTATAVPSATHTASPAPSSTPTPSPTATVEPSPTPTLAPPTRIVSAAIGLDAPVVPVGWHVEQIEGQDMMVWDVADYAAGWSKTSARPGEKGNMVISGHHNIKGEVFRYVVDLKPGDEITVYAGDVAHTYVVTDNMILPEKGMPLEQRRENAKWIGPFDDERLTLVTCWPYTDNTHRVVVVAKPKR